ncbi:Aste57867_20074 [Aphanomyces stellatus]|uniref:Aste57867_20074 protein n=1 Tax=Aphanomyces stellatus TaxID=120398 RepID=A0A485LEU1_9STRA|nr:hypothetical protein As57867_020008 [Aphanomyces stellatus]VFT96769.1 Aste57867_20074 [Aphanomyces stellatus]
MLGESSELAAAKAMNGIMWLAQSTIVVFLPVYYSAYFDKLQIGVLSTIPCFSALIAPPLWGAIADVIQKQRAVHVFCIVTGAVLMFAIQYTSASFSLTCLVVFLANFQTNPTGSLLDQAVMALIERVGGEYGKQRLFGAVGWGIGAFFTGVVVNAYGIAWAFYLHLVFVVPSVFILHFIPPPQPHAAAAVTSSTISFADGIRRVFQKPDVLLLLVVVLLLGILLGAMGSFLGLYLYELSDNNTTLVGTAIWVETISELPAFFYADTIVKRFGIVRVLFLSIVGCGVRISYYAVMTNAWTVLPFELLHGVTFAFAWAAFTNYIYESAAPGTQGTMMGLLNAICNGLGRGAGSLLGGYLYQTYGARAMWLAADMGVPLALLGLFFFARTLPSRNIVDLTKGEHQPLTATATP